MRCTRASTARWGIRVPVVRAVVLSLRRDHRCHPAQTGTAWAAFVAAWTTGVAYLTATVYYQAATQRASAQLTGLDPGVVAGVCGDRVRAASLGAAQWPSGRGTLDWVEP